ncbi:MAG: hypothetical protein OXK73_04035 [Rhodospirillaceae bacterium]|nr:hypothetical protein [Rhodospirillaceae bacterium]
MKVSWLHNSEKEGISDGMHFVPESTEDRKALLRIAMGEEAVIQVKPNDKVAAIIDQLVV